MSAYHIEGIAGTGKTTVSEELKKRGYRVIDADQLSYYGDPKTGEPAEKSPLNWIWPKSEILELIRSANGQPLFICGRAMNQDDFTPYFKKTFLLKIDDDTLRHRLATRTNNDYGKHPDDLALQLEWNVGELEAAKRKGAIVIDATLPPERVVDEILKHVR